MNSVEENIRNAFIAVHKTYENVDKLMEYSRTIANEKTNYKTANGKFLRWRSDNEISGWCIDDFILLFQRETDKKLNNEWRDGPIYVMEIMLSNDKELEQMPTVYLSKFEYEDISSWYKGCSPSNHWRFYHPLRNADNMVIQMNGVEISQAIPKTKEIADQYYWGVKKVSFVHLPLVEINAENVEEKIFGNFEKLHLSK
ncbi:hypothetical protein [Trichococcus alkaliphilus]|uniref:hypothetical protein n=1 Tax=Trichococcus alkaliphilus TaxID=2052943 RepID=UPI000D0B0C8E|nr:hypothetical protein [Trichococcus alkaliphilus]